MNTKSTPKQWSTTSKVIHWVMAIVLAAQVILAYMAANLPLGMEKLALLTRHKSIGMLLLFLVLIRILWRVRTTRPSPVAAVSRIQSLLAKVNHGLLYLVMLGLPLSGWLMSSARGFSVSVFGWFQLPDLVEKSKTSFELMVMLHQGLVYTFYGLLTVHIGAALHHHFVKKNATLMRMLPSIPKQAEKHGLSAQEKYDENSSKQAL